MRVRLSTDSCTISNMTEPVKTERGPASRETTSTWPTDCHGSTGSRRRIWQRSGAATGRWGTAGSSTPTPSASCTPGSSEPRSSHHTTKPAQNRVIGVRTPSLEVPPIRAQSRQAAQHQRNADLNGEVDAHSTYVDML